MNRIPPHIVVPKYVSDIVGGFMWLLLMVATAALLAGVL